ncbi:hypothetical protein [Arabidopsis thaliana]|uniref:RNI-like superfamily protein n=1 Tax=Arabidopsis thaliana TaxID=3702 RepID=Q9C6H1_ARATH|nr:RNI-like superfamily protein [Arabidopsis thaliana]AAG51168.1 hypothetical protein [Arabidopsis thaliana]AEE34539.1 RNI-like superfamily protein [Arabidopsis thaliana]|eukprot:NP_176837.1 RNI-like superfamily protein [Arabidopsis thaliana]
MDEDGEKHVLTKRSSSPELSDKRSGDEGDWRRIPEWRHLWKYVPRLDLDEADFTQFDTLVSFIDSFLSVNRESSLNKFKLRIYCNHDRDKETNNAHMARWISAIFEQNVQHVDRTWLPVEVPPILYLCESLVTLRLCGVVLANLEFMYLPLVKVLALEWVIFANELALEKLISGCLVLESLSFCKCSLDNVNVLRVRSQSLLSFNYYGPSSRDLHFKDLVVTIDAPKLEILKLSHQANIKVEFNFCVGKKFNPNDLSKRKMILHFLVAISRVKNMTIAASTLEIIYDYSRCEPVPLFRDISLLRVEFYQDRWEILPFFLESCPNVKSLVVESDYYTKERTSILSRPRRLLSSLEYVKIKSSWDKLEMKLVSYFIENSPILKKVTLCLDGCSRKESVILRELLTIPRLSSSCQVVVL